MQPIDLEVANWFTSTHPSSPFVRTLTAQRATRDVRYVLRYPAYTEIRASGTRTREIARVELLPLLRDVFLIESPANTIFPAIDSRAATRSPELENFAISGGRANATTKTRRHEE